MRKARAVGQVARYPLGEMLGAFAALTRPRFAVTAQHVNQPIAGIEAAEKKLWMYAEALGFDKANGMLDHGRTVALARGPFAKMAMAVVLPDERERIGLRVIEEPYDALAHFLGVGGDGFLFTAQPGGRGRQGFELFTAIRVQGGDVIQSKDGN
jgi:hypothetical protein